MPERPFNLLVHAARITCALLLLVVTISCSGDVPGSDAGVDPHILGADRGYALAVCEAGDVPVGPPPCKTHATAAYTRYLDSARIVLTRDRSAAVMLSYHDFSCPCYMGGCSDPCAHGGSRVDNVVGTYTFETSRLRVTFAENNHLNWSGDLVFIMEELPSKVSKTWRGPDSLRLGTSLFTAAVLLP